MSDDDITLDDLKRFSDGYSVEELTRMLLHHFAHAGGDPSSESVQEADYRLLMSARILGARLFGDLSSDEYLELWREATDRMWMDGEELWLR